MSEINSNDKFLEESNKIISAGVVYIIPVIPSKRKYSDVDPVQRNEISSDSSSDDEECIPFPDDENA